MRALLFDAPGGPDVLYHGEAPEPVCGPGEVIVDVRATALNRADLAQRAGHYPPPPGASPILGLECAGVVAAVGAEVTSVAVGDRVAALLAGGGMAARAAVDARHVLPLPGAMSFEDAAAIPEAFLTAFQALFLLGEAARGERALVHAAASGVGTAALQLAHRAGLAVCGTASAGKHAAVRALVPGVPLVDYRDADAYARLSAATAGDDGQPRGFDVIVDVVGAPTLGANVAALARDGRLVILAMMGGSVAESFDLRALFARRGTLRASTLRNRSDAYKADLVRLFRAAAWPGFADGSLCPVIDRVLPFAAAADAHRALASNETVGKIVLTMG